MNRFLKENKLEIPEDEIDNIYIWTRVSKTQEVLLSSKSFFKLIEHTFNEEAVKVTQVLKQNCTIIDPQDYKLADFISFMLNKYLIFINNFCNVVSTDKAIINSLACFIAHQKHLFFLKTASLPDMIVRQQSDPASVKSIFDEAFVYFDVQKPLPDYNYRGAILDMLLINRSEQHKYTLTHTINIGQILGEKAISIDSANKYHLINLDKFKNPFYERRAASYKRLLKEWYSMMHKSTDDFVYSSKVLEPQVREVSRYK